MTPKREQQNNFQLVSSLTCTDGHFAIHTVIAFDFVESNTPINWGELIGLNGMGYAILLDYPYLKQQLG